MELMTFNIALFLILPFVPSPMMKPVEVVDNGRLARVVNIPTAEQLPIEVTYYDPALGGINCDGNCGILADGAGWSENDYHENGGRVAACSSEFPTGTVITIYGLGSYVCRDRGCMVTKKWSRRHNQLVFALDVLATADSAHIQGLYPHWSASKPLRAATVYDECKYSRSESRSKQLLGVRVG